MYINRYTLPSHYMIQFVLHEKKSKDHAVSYWNNASNNELYLPLTFFKAKDNSKS